VVCVSLHSSLSPEISFSIGEALRPLREENILILGSGYTFHNMHAFFNPSDKSYDASRKFNDWLKHVIMEEGNLKALKDWEKAPGAR
jgi:4,5-DOPA dioxygenase extradiol